MLFHIRYFKKAWHVARSEQVLPGTLSGGGEGGISRKITVLQRSKLRCRELDFFDQGNTA